MCCVSTELILWRLAQAAAAADVAEVAVVVLGLSTCHYSVAPGRQGGDACLEAEGRDRRGLQLPAVQARDDGRRGADAAGGGGWLGDRQGPRVMLIEDRNGEDGG